MGIFFKKIEKIATKAFLSGAHGEQSREKLRKIILLNSISTLGIAALIALGLVAVCQEAYWLGAIDFIVALVLAGLLTHLRITGNYTFSGYTGISVLGIFYLYLFISGGVNTTAFMWHFTFPLVALFLLGVRHGTMAIMALFLPSLLFLGINLLSTNINVYNQDFAFRFIPSFLIVFLFSYLAEKSREKAQQEIRLINNELEERIETRTNELRREIEEKQQAQSAILRAKQEWERTFNSVPDLIAVINQNQQIIRANKAMSAALNIPLDQLTGMFCYQAMHGTDSAPDCCPLKQVQEDMEPQSIEIYEQRLQKHLNITVSPLLDDNGVFYGAVHVARDVTEKKRAEEKRVAIKAKLQKAEKMHAIGLMAGGVAHDLNNILSGLVSYPELLLLRLPKDSDLCEDVQAMKDAGKRAAEVVTDLLTVARGAAVSRSITNLNILAREYLNSPEHKKISSRHPSVSCLTQLDRELCNISCSSIHVKKCLMNLVNNAAESIEDKGSITISTCHSIVEKPFTQIFYVEKGEYAVLSITDTGSGIAKKDLEHIFEPFYTKKIMGISGTGLGLTVVWNTMQDHDGAITVESSDKGTTFHLYFPVCHDELSVLPEINELKNLQGHGERILVVDDEPLQRDIAGKKLTVLGYKVHAESSGEEAIKFLKKHSVDLVLLDMIMDPGINGRQTYEEIIKMHPSQKAVIVTGFSENEEVIKAQQLGAEGFIKKPYTLEEIALAVQAELKKNKR